jgi:mono/diheme cytochrome c family protein
VNANVPVAALAAVLMAALLCGCTRQPAPAPAQPATPPAVRYESHLAAGGLLPPGAVLRNPHAGDVAVAKSGAQLFNAMNCDGCHGEDASGNWAPNLGDGRWRYGGADAEVFSSIYYGRPKGMPGFGGALGAEGVWTLVTYLRSLAPPPNIPTESWQEPP